MMGFMGNYNQVEKFYRVSRINSEAKPIYPRKRIHIPFVFSKYKCMPPELQNEASNIPHAHTEHTGHNQGQPV